MPEFPRLVAAIALIVMMIGLAAGKVPSYIEVCGRHNPKLNECVERSVRKLRPKLQAGIAELEVPGLEPLPIDRVVPSEREDFRAVASGLSDFLIQHMQLELDQRRIHFRVLFDRVFLKTNYDVKAKIIVPIAERGLLDILTCRIVANVTMRFKIVERGPRQFIYFPSMTVSLDISDYTLSSLPTGQDKPLARAINSVLTSSRREIINKLTPDLEKAVSAKVLEMANKICKHFTFD